MIRTRRMNMQRTFAPEIISTKENLLTALRNGDIKSSKYNLLNEEEKLFVELVVFGGYNAEQAMMSIKNSNYHKGQGSRMCARPNVADALEELSYKKNKKFMAEIASSRDLALRKLMYIMNTTEDESVAAACAKTILDKAEKITTEKEAANAVNAIQFNINLAPKPVDVSNPKVDLDSPVIMDVVDYEEKVDNVINPEQDNSSGLDFKLNYQSVDNYNK
jgi:hypothetical protein